MKHHLVLARKYRPRQFADVVWQTHVVRALTNALKQNYLHHAYLFTGTRGVGKTTIARLLAKCLNCETGVTAEPCTTCQSCREIEEGRFVDLIEVDAASRTKVEDTRELLDNIQYSPTKGRFKIYLIDEVHMLSRHSFNALLKTLEEPPSHIKFLLATTDPQRLPATVLSRCLQFHLLAMPVEQIQTHLQHILTQENVPYETSATQLLAEAAKGSMRDALSLLDQGIAYGDGKILTSDIKTMLGTIDKQVLYELLDALTQPDANAVLAGVNKLAAQGADFSQALADLLSLLHQIAILQTVPNGPAAPEQSFAALAKKISQEDIQLYYQIGLLGQRDLPWSPSPQAGFEMTLLKMYAFTPQEPILVPLTQVTEKTEISWGNLITQLQLDGGTKALAEHCALKSLDDKHLHLLLPVSKQALMNQKHIERIREALCRYQQKPMTVEISLESSTSESPADKARLEKERQQQLAEQAILNDPIVKKMMQAFNATLVKTSVEKVQ